MNSRNLCLNDENGGDFLKYQGLSKKYFELFMAVILHLFKAKLIEIRPLGGGGVLAFLALCPEFVRDWLCVGVFCAL
jgi:hypothetical protein